MKDKKDNHTIQNFFIVNGYERFAVEVNDYFNQIIMDGSIEELTLRETIKTTTDKFIAHYDTITGSNSDDLEYEFDSRRTFYRFICETELSRESGCHNIFEIYSFLQSKFDVVLKNKSIDLNSIGTYMLL